MNGAIPFLDLVTPHRELKEQLTTVFQNALDTAEFVGGPAVASFERAFAAFCQVAHCVGVGSGTDALRFALIAAGVCPGDAVITVPNTFIATTEAISQAGATPEFVDVDQHTYNMDACKLHEHLEANCIPDPQSGKLISRRSGRPVGAIVPVHLYGQMADMDEILAIAERYQLIVVEDACQAHGAEYFSKRHQRWCRAGSMGKAAAFSFYPGKNLGACGEGGAVTTSDEEVAQKIRLLRDHGQSRKYHHEIEGYNGRLDAIQAGILEVKLKHLPAYNAARQAVAYRYGQLLEQGLRARNSRLLAVPFVPEWVRPVYHLYVIRVSDRDGLIQQLASKSIGTGNHYPTPLHLQKAYSGLQYHQGDFPISERTASRIVSLPMYPTLSIEQQRTVAAEVLRPLHSDWEAAPEFFVGSAQ